MAQVDTAAQAVRVTSPSFADGQEIPRRYTGDGEDRSPPLAWSEAPRGTRTIALVCDDPDAPSGVFVHWLIWNIPSNERGLPEGYPASDAANGVRQGRNDFGRTGYGGPAPPPGKPHHYRFHVYALDAKLETPSGASRAELDRAMSGHVLAQGVLVGTYRR